MKENQSPDSISGIYPSLAFYNDEGECGVGAVVPWAGKLWAITYGPHLANGSSDKLYEIYPDFTMTERIESTGGTPANRMIHKESQQLFIGPYAIDKQGKVRVISYEDAPGRYTGTARHLTDPANKLYMGTMEEGFYEVDVHSLATNELYADGNKKGTKDLLFGAHGKGLYSGQGVLLYSNNGEPSKEALHQFDIEAGSLSEWDGKDWKLVRRNQFTEITGPGGIYGNTEPNKDPIWSVGWDHKSLILGVREQDKGWSFYRLPKASHSYDGAHGWNTEWPRIRDVGTSDKPDYLMTMHGMFWKFPKTFTTGNSAGIRPRSAYLKVIGDFARWNDHLVFGCDDSAQKEFLNKRKAKGNAEGPGQSNSNLWFTSFSKLDELGPATAEGAVWAKENVKANVYSEPFMFSGWPNRSVWISNGGARSVNFTLEVDELGNNSWKTLKTIKIDAGKSLNTQFSDNEKGEWIRVKTDVATKATVSFTYKANDDRKIESDKIFNGLAAIDRKNTIGGLLYGLGDNRRSLGILANTNNGNSISETSYYEMGDKFELIRKDDEKAASFIREKFAIPTQVVTIEKGSVLVIDDKNRRWRLPLGNTEHSRLIEKGEVRICREVATERDLFNCHGTFYELPAENADGYAKIRPIASHNFAINDYASYRGMLVLTGISPELNDNNPHIIVSDDKKAAVWVGTIDDLWNMGKPIGKGGPWKDSRVKAGEPSDPYLFAFYDKKNLNISHKESNDVVIRIEMDPTGNGDWMVYGNYTVKAGENFIHQIPEHIQAHWIRFVTDKDATITTWLEYK